MSFDLGTYLKEKFGIDELYMPLVGRAPWGVNIELTDWSGEGDEWRVQDLAVASAEGVLDYIQCSKDQMTLVVKP